MKQTLKGICQIVMLAFLAFAILPGMPDSVWAAASDEVDEDMRITLSGTAESLSQAIVELSQEEIDDYRESGDEFTINTMEVWESSRKELGEFEKMNESIVEKTSTGYSVKIPAEFSDQDAQFVYLFDRTGTPVSFGIDIQYPMSALLQRAGMNTLMGMGIVFAMLIFLTFMISLFRFIGKAGEASPKEKRKEDHKEIEELPRSAHAQKLLQPQPAEEGTEDAELVAVIAAAIAAYEGTSTDGFVVRSIRKANRRKTVW